MSTIARPAPSAATSPALATAEGSPCRTVLGVVGTRPVVDIILVGDYLAEPRTAARHLAKA